MLKPHRLPMLLASIVILRYTKLHIQSNDIEAEDRALTASCSPLYLTCIIGRSSLCSLAFVRFIAVMSFESAASAAIGWCGWAWHTSGGRGEWRERHPWGWKEASWPAWRGETWGWKESSWPAWQGETWWKTDSQRSRGRTSWKGWQWGVMCAWSSHTQTGSQASDMSISWPAPCASDRSVPSPEFVPDRMQ